MAYHSPSFRFTIIDLIFEIGRFWDPDQTHRWLSTRNIADLGPVLITMEARQGATLYVLGWVVAEAIVLVVTQRLARIDSRLHCASLHCPAAAFPFAQEEEERPSDDSYLEQNS